MRCPALFVKTEVHRKIVNTILEFVAFRSRPVRILPNVQRTTIHSCIFTALHYIHSCIFTSLHYIHSCIVTLLAWVAAAWQEMVPFPVWHLQPRCLATLNNGIILSMQGWLIGSTSRWNKLVRNTIQIQHQISCISYLKSQDWMMPMFNVAKHLGCSCHTGKGTISCHAAATQANRVTIQEWI